MIEGIKPKLGLKVIDPEFCNGCPFLKLETILARVPGYTLEQVVPVLNCARRGWCDNYDQPYPLRPDP